MTARYRARACVDGRRLADTAAAIRVEHPGTAPDLWFPLADIDLGALDEVATATGRAWRLRGAEQPVLRAATGDAAGGPEGTAAFDHDRVLVEVVDPSPDGDPRATSVKRFPTWGDADDLIGLLDVAPLGDGRYRSGAKADWRRPVTEGSQVLGQAVVAAARHAPGRRVVSAHLVLTRVIDAEHGFELHLDEAAGGRTFTALDVRAVQRGRIGATGTLLLDATAPDVIRHEVPAPVAPGPLDCPSVDMSVTGRDIRIPEGTYTGDPDAPVGPPTIDAWVRFAAVPDDPAIHAALLAQFTGHISIAAALRPHAGVGQAEAHRTLSTGINAIALAFHRDVRADRWMHYHHHSTFSGDGMTHSTCTVHDEAGHLLASFSVDAMVRAFAAREGDTPRDTRTAL